MKNSRRLEQINYTELLLDDSNEPIWIIEKTDKGSYYFVKVSKAFRKHIHRSDIDGRKVSDIVKGPQLTDLKESLNAAAKAGVFVTEKELFREKSKKALSSRIVFKPLYNGKSLFIGFSCDITAHVETREALEKEKVLSEAYLEVAGVMIIVLDKHGNVELINKKGCDLLGYDKNTIIGKNWFNNNAHSEKSGKNFRKMISGREPKKNFEDIIVTKSGDERLINWHSSLLYDSCGKVTGLLCSGEDVTETRKLQNELITQSHNSDFLYILSRAISDTLDITDLLSKSAKVLMEYPGMLGGLICTGSSSPTVCAEEISFGSFDKIFKERKEYLREILYNYDKGGNLHHIEDLYYKHYGTKNKAYTGMYKIRTKNRTYGVLIALTSSMDSTLNNFFMLVAAELGRALNRKKTEIEQKISEEKFLSVFNTSPDAIVISTLESGTYVEVNRSFEEMTGFSRVDLIARNADNLPIWVDPEERSNLVKKVKAGKKVTGFLAVLRKKDGTVYNALISASRINFDGEKCMLTVSKDVSDRIKIENEISNTKQLLEKITYTSPSFICLYDATHDKVLYSNKSILQSLGYTKEDLSVFRKFGKGHKKTFYHPDDLPKINEFDKKMLILEEGEIAKIEYRLKDSQSRWQWFQQTTTIFQKNPENTEVLTINIFENITDRKLAEEETQKHSNEIELLYQAGKAISGTLDLNEIYDRMYQIISEIADCRELRVSLYDPVKQLIHYKYLRTKAASKKVDVSKIPPIPLAPRGFGIISEVIRTSKPMIIDDYDEYFRKVKTSFVIREEVDINHNEESEFPKSALVIPIKLEEKIIGAVQIFSSRYKAYNFDQLKFVEALMHQVALANKNAIVFEQAQNEIRERKLAQENLKISERNLRQFAESVPDVIYRLNYETQKYDFISAAVVTLLGYEMNEVLSDPAGFSTSVIYPEDYEFVRDSVMNHLKFGKVNHPLQIECRLVRKDGQIIWVRDIIVFEYKRGKLSAAIGAMSDITEKKMMEVRRRQRDERIIRYQSALLELSRLHSSDIDGNLQRISEITSEALGVERTSIWLFSDNRNTLDCRARFWLNTPPEAGVRLEISEYKELINKLMMDENLSFGNSKSETKPKGYAEFFTLPGISSSSLITRIHYQGDVAGFLSIESAEEGKTEWTPEEYDFAVSVSGFISLIIESEERLQAEEEIKRALKDKELLLREIHHRVKNNLQVISSLLYLQNRKSNDMNLREALIESQNRVKTMVMIHEKLYKSEDLASFNYSEYIKELTSSLFSSYRLDSSRISLDLDVGKIILDTDTAIHCGLIINEVVSNSMKYAFPEGREGRISIKFHKNEPAEYILEIADNGVGMAQIPEIDKIDSLGMQLVKTLIEQINGHMQIINKDGLKYIFRFSLN